MLFLEKSDSDQKKKQGGSKDNVFNVNGLDAAKFSTVVPKNCLLNSVARKDNTVMTTWAWSHKLSWAEPKFSTCKWVEKALPLMEWIQGSHQVIQWKSMKGTQIFDLLFPG